MNGGVTREEFVRVVETFNPGGLTLEQKTALYGVVTGFLIALGADTLTEDECERLIDGLNKIKLDKKGLN